MEKAKTLKNSWESLVEGCWPEKSGPLARLIAGGRPGRWLEGSHERHLSGRGICPDHRHHRLAGEPARAP
ncbi:MAG: hypothetical protein R2860_10420 [Desulfobacterales bacterium]